MSSSGPPSAVEMRHLRLVAAIVEHGSMTAASRALDLTQPALSHQLRELESRLRTPLFVRTARRMVPTPAGEQLAQLGRAVLAQVGTFERQLRDGELSSVRGTVRIATECYTAYHWLPVVLRGFCERWPGVDLRIAAEHTSAPIAALRNGALDLAIVLNRPAEKRVRVEPLFDDELVVVCATDHRFASMEFVPLELLADEQLFIYTSHDHDSTVLREILAPASVVPAQVTRIQLTEAILELVAAGLGVAVLARWAVLPALRNGVIGSARLGRRGYTRTWYTATRSGDVIPAYQSDLVELLRRHVAGGPAVRMVPRQRSS